MIRRIGKGSGKGGGVVRKVIRLDFELMMSPIIKR